MLNSLGLTPTADYLSQVDNPDRDHHHHSHHLENDGFKSISFQSDRPFSVEKFEHFLTEEMPDAVFRAKGILWFDDRLEDRYIFQLSGARYDMQFEPWQTSPQNQIVFIGRHLDKTEIFQKLECCLATSATVS
jgi:G3E family GTPase